LLDTIVVRLLLVAALNLGPRPADVVGPARWPASPTRPQKNSAASAPLP
jgi:hypothetical protein